MKAIRHSRFGPPEEVVEMVDMPDEAGPAADEVIVHAELAPIHPADLLSMEGLYGTRRPDLPAFCGTDGIGRVVEVGREVHHLRTGDRVALLFTYRPTWREQIKAKAEPLFALPDGDARQMAMLGANPVTAWALLHDFAGLAPGDWIIQNAAASSVGRAVIALAGELGIRTVNVVRRPEAVAELLSMGADICLQDGPDLCARVLEATDGSAPLLGIDAVGGAATLRLGEVVARDATVVSYGLLSGEPGQLNLADVIFRNVSLRGFWLARWMRQKKRQEITEIYQHLASLVSNGTISAPVSEIYPLGGFKNALAHASRSGRSGKILLRLEADNG